MATVDRAEVPPLLSSSHEDGTSHDPPAPPLPAPRPPAPRAPEDPARSPAARSPASASARCSSSACTTTATPRLALLRRAVELGVDHVDTAQFYGNGFVNELIREALRPEDGVVVVSKVGADPDPGGPDPAASRAAARGAAGERRGQPRHPRSRPDPGGEPAPSRLRPGPAGRGRPGGRPRRPARGDDRAARRGQDRRDRPEQRHARRAAPGAPGGHRLRAERLQPRVPRRRGHAAAVRRREQSPGCRSSRSAAPSPACRR